MDKSQFFSTILKESDFSGMHDAVLPGTFTADTLGNISMNGKKRNDMKKENRRKAPKEPDFTTLMSFLNSYDKEEYDFDADELDDPELDPANFDELLDQDIDFTSTENEEDDIMSLNFDDDFNEHDLDDEFYDEEDFEPDVYDDENEVLSDDVLDEINGITGCVVNWWREDESEKNKFSDLDNEYEEEQEEIKRQRGPTKIDQARIRFQQLINQPNMSRNDIINAFIQDIDMTESTAVSYYEKIAHEFGLTNLKQEEKPNVRRPQMPEPISQPQRTAEEKPTRMEGRLDKSGNPDRQGIIRQVNDAHLVYKRQSEDGTFQELWLFNIGDMKSELKIRRAILAGTDIPQNKTRSDDGSQEYSIETMGNGQLLSISGLPN